MINNSKYFQAFIWLFIYNFRIRNESMGKYGYLEHKLITGLICFIQSLFPEENKSIKIIKCLSTGCPGQDEKQNGV